jgi:polysaccharide export outer membrane protein
LTGAQAQGREHFAVVELDYAVTQAIASRPPAALTGLAGAGSLIPNDRIAAGDILAVTIFEAGGGLFAPSNSASPGSTLPRVVVDAQGEAVIPYGGGVHVAGLDPYQAAQAIRAALRGRTIDPQVIVSVVESPANSVAVIGEVRNAGRHLLTANNDRLLDALASAGGPTRPAADLDVVVMRGGATAEAPLGRLFGDATQNIRLAPRDQVRVIWRPRKFATFGAFLHDGQTTIEDETLTLAAALGRAGGLDTNSANAKSVMVFRFERPEVARALGVTVASAPKGVPIVYRLNLREPDGVFVANSFNMQADDILYVPRSDATEVQKFFSLVNSVTQVGYNVRVTSAIP